jgi:hypothetical protein
MKDNNARDLLYKILNRTRRIEGLLGIVPPFEDTAYLHEYVGLTQCHEVDVGQENIFTEFKQLKLKLKKLEEHLGVEFIETPPKKEYRRKK